MALSTKLFSLVVFLVLLAPSLSDLQMPKKIAAVFSSSEATDTAAKKAVLKPTVMVAAIDSYQRIAITSGPFQDGRVH